MAVKTASTIGFNTPNSNTLILSIKPTSFWYLSLFGIYAVTFLGFAFYAAYKPIGIPLLICAIALFIWFLIYEISRKLNNTNKKNKKVFRFDKATKLIFLNEQPYAHFNEVRGTTFCVTSDGESSSYEFILRFTEPQKDVDFFSKDGFGVINTVIEVSRFTNTQYYTYYNNHLSLSYGRTLLKKLLGNKEEYDKHMERFRLYSDSQIKQEINKRRWTFSKKNKMDYKAAKAVLKNRGKGTLLLNKSQPLNKQQNRPETYQYPHLRDASEDNQNL